MYQKNSFKSSRIFYPGSNNNNKYFFFETVWYEFHFSRIKMKTAFYLIASK